MSKQLSTSMLYWQLFPNVLNIQLCPNVLSWQLFPNIEFTGCVEPLIALLKDSILAKKLSLLSLNLRFFEATFTSSSVRVCATVLILLFTLSWRSSESLDSVTALFAIFGVMTAPSAILEIVTALAPSFSFVIAPSAIFGVVTALSASFSVVTFKFTILCVVTELSANLSFVTALSANLLVVIIPSGILSPDITKSVFGNIAISQYAFFSIPISFLCSSKTILGLFSCVEKWLALHTTTAPSILQKS